MAKLICIKTPFQQHFYDVKSLNYFQLEMPENFLLLQVGDRIEKIYGKDGDKSDLLLNEALKKLKSFIGNTIDNNHKSFLNKLFPQKSTLTFDVDSEHRLVSIQEK